jgi:hypothetical protein
MKHLASTLVFLAAVLAPLSAVSQSYTAQSGVSFFVQQSATATATSGAIRLPNFSGAGTLTVTETAITGSPSGCTIKLAYQSNVATTATATVSTVSFTPATGSQTFTIAPSIASGDAYVATYACSSTYPTAGFVNVSFSPIATETITNVAGTTDPCQNPSVLKSSAVISVASAGEASLVALSTTKAIYVCGVVDGSAGTTPSLVLQYGTVAGCASGTTALTGAIPFTSGGVLNLGWHGTIVTAPVGDVLCALTVGAGHYGVVTYVQQ